jgi:uncharacterized membrane protein
MFGTDGGWGFGMGLGMWVFWILLIVIIVALVKVIGPGSGSNRQPLTKAPWKFSRHAMPGAFLRESHD